MTVLLLGLVVFLAAHSVRIVADDWRTRTIARIGAQAWKGAYSLISLIGLGLIVWGFSLARSEPLPLWSPPLAMRHLASLLILFAFVLLVATYVPGNAIKARLHHPMVLAVKVWALAHLLANGNAADVVLFGAFLVWAVLSFAAARRRDRVAATVYLPGSVRPTVLTVVVGGLAWAVFAFWLHGLLFGVQPFG
ncbi:MAG: NnrU family protein [Candidatus Accumulibacter sp.]|uniref:NnrU family protein n=1 Tax=Accumulibacter sp. TaxID=2053492 RepID=UPI0019FDB94C|nr:NnrU family protein [Accumulibacter sp.]MBE2258158.1 NnrU family protein [Paracoccaceae bacterium]MCP5249122.1 NnrU family protein [Accumulibacter sp.]